MDNSDPGAASDSTSNTISQIADLLSSWATSQGQIQPSGKQKPYQRSFRSRWTTQASPERGPSKTFRNDEQLTAQQKLGSSPEVEAVKSKEKAVFRVRSKAKNTVHVFNRSDKHLETTPEDVVQVKKPQPAVQLNMKRPLIYSSFTQAFEMYLAWEDHKSNAAAEPTVFLSDRYKTKKSTMPSCLNLSKSKGQIRINRTIK